MENIFKNKVILITGSVGTVGAELLRQLIPYEPAEVRIMDNDETGLFMQAEEYRSAAVVVRPFLGDVRDQAKLSIITRDVEIIFHLAAFKHVILSEYSPFDAVQTNVIGTQNVVQAALLNNVKRLLFTSSDKAVNPTNVMGTSKLMSERIVSAANTMNNNGRGIFSSTRFGNVIGSRGSVVPIFIEQIKKGGPVTVTDERMTRFVMTVQDAVRLVIKACELSKGGEVFITKMSVMHIMDLAEAMIGILAPLYGYSPKSINIQLIGAKPGEKMYEELMSEEETARSMELEYMFVTLPAFRSVYNHIEYDYPDIIQRKVNRPYISHNEPKMTKEQIKHYLLSNHILRDLINWPALSDNSQFMADRRKALSL
jgi:FlaA1/EpsC-like NDP-sugar epimerase